MKGLFEGRHAPNAPFSFFKTTAVKESFLLFFFLIFPLLIFPGSAMSQPSVKVGAFIPFTGRWGDAGRECAKGLLDAGKWINQKGGVNGRRLEIFLVEDTDQMAETLAAYRKLNEADRILLLYIYSPQTSLALVPHVHYDHLPTVVGTLPSSFADPVKYPYLFSIVPTPLDLAKIGMKYISEKSGVKSKKPKLIFAGTPHSTGKDFLEAAKAFGKSLGFEIGPDVWITESLSKTGSTFSLAPFSSFNPDFAYLSLPVKETIPLLQEAKNTTLKTRWICGMKAFDENLAPFDGILGVQPVSPFGEDVPGMAGIKEAHQKWHPFDSHTLSYVEGWATAQVIAESIARSLPGQGYSRDRVKLGLESFKNYILGGLVPPLTITSMDHRPSVESRILITREGKISRYTDFISVGR
jgi:branched-chain amino acid transport system substrate-binding protein